MRLTRLHGLGSRRFSGFWGLGTSLLILVICSASGLAQSWTRIQIPFNVGGAMLLLTDGTVLIQQQNSGSWWVLTPQKFTMAYSTGTFAVTGVLPAGYVPKFFASAVLPDGRAIVEGGEYNNGVKDWTTLGAIYDPVAKSWVSVAPPSGWTKIGDAPSVVLPDGTYMLGTCCGKKAALLDASTLTWSAAGFGGKCDSNNEEGWTLLPDGNVLAIDAYVGGCALTDNSEIYNTALATWSSGNSTLQQLWDPCGTHEIGPAVLMPDGSVLATGANNCGSAGHTALYDTVSGVWSLGPDFPSLNDMADAPAAVLPNGNVLVDTNPGWGKSPSTFYTFNAATASFVAIPQPPFFPSANTEGARMLILPSGNILVGQGGQPNLWFFKPAGTYNPGWQPHICPGCYPATAQIGGTYTVSGTQFNGFTQGTFYGDDSQNATNYPIAVITNAATGHKFFARTHGFTTMGVVTGGTKVSAQFDVLLGTETGNSSLQLFTNGIPSNPVGFQVTGQ